MALFRKKQTRRPPIPKFNIRVSAHRDRFLDAWWEISPRSFDEYHRKAGGTRHEPADAQLMVELLREDFSNPPHGAWRASLKKAGFQPVRKFG